MQRGLPPLARGAGHRRGGEGCRSLSKRFSFFCFGRGATFRASECEVKEVDLAFSCKLQEFKKKRHAVGRREIDEKNAREKERGRESRRKSQAAERPTTAASSKGFPLLSLSLVSRCCRQQLLLLSSSISGAPVSDTERRLLVFLPRAWRLAAREGATEKGGEEQRKVISERHRLFFFAFVVDFLFRRRQIFQLRPERAFFRERRKARSFSLSLSSRSLRLSFSLSGAREKRRGRHQPCRLAGPRGAPRRAELLLLQRPLQLLGQSTLTSTSTLASPPSLPAASPLPLTSRGRKRRRQRNWPGEFSRIDALWSRVALFRERESREREIQMSRLRRGHRSASLKTPFSLSLLNSPSHSGSSPPPSTSRGRGTPR